MAVYTAEQKLSVINGSPAAVAAHNKRAWLALFAEYNVVEDPVGSCPHVSGIFDHRSGRRGNNALSRFYDSFIAPNIITFDVQHDIVNGNTVVRDLNIEIAMSKRVVVTVPMHLRYRLSEEQGALKISHLAAYWELLPMVKQAFGFGVDSLLTLSNMGLRLLRNMGLSGLWGFVGGLRGVGHNGKVLVQEMFSALNNHDANHLQLLIDRDVGRPCLAGPDGVAISSSHFVLQHPGTFSVGKVISSGYSCSASFNYQDGDRSVAGVMIADCARGSGKITAAHFFVQADQAV
ncbi:hypothetical protein SIN8267_02839 [Sinobacterium norvegicum]|uniref:SnoaL-like domain-containing protein n=1 Tax=Sinobacterium norvegicum TaxID=1641715 RepID=A0ABM9AIV6_9GAMM|nr:nuclear transport factor 2 family protein [Sinobacterium norvegicum]CAH0992706.1 hypothetical protein SIN8267_02839 [Sinobacterium norvegicum]